MYHVESVHNIKYKNLQIVNIIKTTDDVYHPLNYPAIVDTLTNYLNIHGLLLLSSVSNKFRTCLYNKFSFIFNKPKESHVVDMIEHQCFKCYMYFSFIDYKNEQVMAIFSLNNNKACQFMKIYLLRSNFKNLSPETVNYCVKMVIKNNVDFNHPIVEHLGSIIRINKITDFNVLKNLISLLTIEKVNYAIERDLLLMYNNLDKELFFILLPLYCKRDFAHLLESKYFNEEHISLILNLISKYDTFSIRNTLIDILLDIIDNPSSTQLNIILPIINQHYSIYNRQNLFNKISFNNLSNEQKLMLSKFYDNTCDLSFLDETPEYNLISLSLSHVNYTSKLSQTQILKHLVKIDNLNFINDQLLKLNQLNVKDLKYLNTISVKKMRKSTILHLLTLTIDEELKMKLIEKAYEHGYSNELKFLDMNKRYNKLSLKFASYNYTGYVYVSHLSFEEKLKYIKKYENAYHVVKILVYHLKKYDISKLTPYKNESVIFESNTINDDDVITNKYYKLLSGKKIDYYKWLYDIKMINYKQFVYYSFSDIQKNMFSEYTIKKDYKKEIIHYIVTQPEFPTLDFQLVLYLLKYYVSDDNIVKELIKHPFFDVFYVKKLKI